MPRRDHEDAAESTAMRQSAAVAPASPAATSLDERCREVERTIGREPGDRVRCAHLFGDYYRCNWWSRTGAVAGQRSGYDWAGLLTDHVRRSRFLRVTATYGRLKVEEVAEPAGGRWPGPT